MGGKALTWFQGLEESSQIGDWDSLTRALLARFSPGGYDDPVETLPHLRQCGIVEEYKDQFESLSNSMKGLTDQYKLSLFLSGQRMRSY